ncbi:MAG: hypothetical protein AAGK71_03280 [Pseudomonadota bacterium]
MFFEDVTCNETVSILEALVFGANGACVDIGMYSLLGAVAAFVGCVILIRLVAMRVLSKLFPGLRGARQETVPDVQPQQKDTLQPLPYESPIRSTGAWGGRKR